MFPSSQPSYVVRTLSKAYSRGRVLNWHQHSEGQLLYAVCGVIQVRTTQGQWTVPPQRALWIPPIVEHEVTMLSNTEIRSLHVLPSIDSVPRKTVQTVATSPLMRELIMTLFEPQFEVEIRNRVVALLSNLISLSRELPSHLAMPSNPHLRHVAQNIVENCRWNTPVTEIATAVNMSERSFTRHFSQEVGMSFRSWRQRARVIASLDQIVTRQSIKAVAFKSGFNDSSAFVAAFKQVMGCTPAQYVDKFDR